MTLEKLIAPHLDLAKTYSLRAFELWGDGDGYSVNSAWTFERDLTPKEALRAARDRFEIYKVNYAPKARIKDLDIEWNDLSFSLVHDKLPVIEFYETEGSQPKTLTNEFAAGMKSGEHPHSQNTIKAITAVARKSTKPHVRAYWTGYLCMLTLDQIEEGAA